MCWYSIVCIHICHPRIWSTLKDKDRQRREKHLYCWIYAFSPWKRTWVRFCHCWKKYTQLKNWAFLAWSFFWLCMLLQLFLLPQRHRNAWCNWCFELVYFALCNAACDSTSVKSISKWLGKSLYEQSKTRYLCSYGQWDNLDVIQVIQNLSDCLVLLK